MPKPRFPSYCLFALMLMLLSRGLVAESITLANARVVDVLTGDIQLRDVVIDDGRIATIAAPDNQRGQDTRVMDVGQRYVIPGLWDMHVHFEGRDLVEDNALLLPVYLAYGITGVREAASNLADTVLTWRDQIATGERLGPRLFTAGQKFEGVGSLWGGDREIGSLEDMRSGMDEQEAARVDFIKITENTLAPDLFLATVAEAHRRDFLVSGHVPVALGIFELADAGLSSIEHASNVLRLGHPREAHIARAVREGTLSTEDARASYEAAFDQGVAQTGYRKLAESGVAVTPTLIGGRQLAWLDETDHSEDPFLRYLTRDFTANYQWRIERMANENADQRARRKARYRLTASQLPFLQEAGVILLAGSDSAALNTYVYPAEALHTELRLFVEAGLSPLEALQAATINAARFMRRADMHGSIEVGKAADLIVLESNPLADISALQDIHALVYRGDYRDRRQLDTLLKEAAARKESLEKSREESGHEE